MASTRNIAVNAARRSPAGFPGGPTSLFDVFLEAQRVQRKALLSWQESLATCGKLKRPATRCEKFLAIN